MHFLFSGQPIMCYCHLSGRFLLCSVLLAASRLPIAPSHAANTIDPNSIGSTDVVEDPFGAATTLVNPLADPLTISFDLAVGNNAAGELRIDAGSDLTITGQGYIGNFSGSNGVVTVTGSSSQLNVGGTIFTVAAAGNGTLNILDGGVVSSPTTTSFIGGFDVASNSGTVKVNGSGSQWISGSVHVGERGNGLLIVEAGGVVASVFGRLGVESSGSTGTATVTGSGSQWNTDVLEVGLVGNGTIIIADNGLVAVGQTTSIGTGGAVILINSRFEFGTIDTSSYGKISGTSSELAGDLLISGFNSLAALGVSIPNLDVSEVRVVNGGVIFGTGVSPQVLANSATGEVRTLSGEWARFSGVGNTNSGEINNFGGLVEFEQDLTNEATGFVGGRGQFIADGGWTNEGVMAFSAGPADVLGDVANSATGQIITSGGAVTTFFDDVVHNGAEIRTSAGSSTVIFGAASGAGPYTGTGTVFFEGDLRPGNSPDVVTLGGDVVLGTGAETFIELNGTLTGLFDRLVVNGTISLAGTLDVQLVSGFTPSAGDSFEIISAGSLLGDFVGINLPPLPGDLLWFVNQTATTLELVSTFAADFDEDGTVGGVDLTDWEAGYGGTSATHMTGDANADTVTDGLDFLTWQRQFSDGGGASLAAATIIPEPSSLLLAALGLLTLSARRKRA